MYIRKRIPIFLVVVLLMGIFSGCAASGSGSQGNTSPSVTPSGSEQTDPTATGLVMSEEEKALVAAAVAAECDEYRQERFEMGEYWYLGTYNGCIALSFGDIPEADLSEFYLAVKDGHVYTLEECYGAGYITLEQMLQIEDIYDQLTAVPKTTFRLSEEDKALVAAAYTGYVENYEVYLEELERGDYWYLGTYDGWIAVYLTDFLHAGNTDHYDWIDLIKDGQLYTLRECYQAGYITQEQYIQVGDMYDAAEEANRVNS